MVGLVVDSNPENLLYIHAQYGYAAKVVSQTKSFYLEMNHSLKLVLKNVFASFK